MECLIRPLSPGTEKECKNGVIDERKFQAKYQVNCTCLLTNAIHLLASIIVNFFGCLTILGWCYNKFPVRNNFWLSNLPRIGPDCGKAFQADSMEEYAHRVIRAGG